MGDRDVLWKKNNDILKIKLVKLTKLLLDLTEEAKAEIFYVF